MASSFGSAQTGKPNCRLQGQGSGSFQGSECGLPLEGSTSLRLFSAAAGMLCMSDMHSNQHNDRRAGAPVLQYKVMSMALSSCIETSQVHA